MKSNMFARVVNAQLGLIPQSATRVWVLGGVWMRGFGVSPAMVGRSAGGAGVEGCGYRAQQVKRAPTARCFLLRPPPAEAAHPRTTPPKGALGTDGYCPEPSRT